MKARTLIGVVAGAGLVFGGIVAVVFFSSASIDVQHLAREQAQAEITRVRARFGPDLPCVDRDRPPPRRPSPAEAPQAVHMLAWEQEHGRLVRATTPYWALRAGSWKMNAARAIAPPLRYIAWVDLERCGRGLLLDHATEGGGRVLIWAE